MSAGRLDPEVERFFREGAGRGAAADLVKETPIAAVFLAGDVAWKLKKPVDFGFVDYSTLEKRRWAVGRELSFNRRHAPHIYRAALPVVLEAGRLRLGAPEEAAAAVEWALEMRRFDEGAILANAPARVHGAFAERIGREVAALQAGAEVKPRGGGTWALGFTVRSNAEQLRGLAPVLGEAAVARYLAEVEAAFAAAVPQLEARREAGLARHCHGDLHLANLVVEADGRFTPFDSIEFNDRLSDVDVGYDAAFLIMDLAFRGQRDGASRALHGWLDAAARWQGDHAFTGLKLLPLFLSVRAAVRAHVSAHADPAQGRAYLAAAQAHLEPGRAELRAVGGLSGSGKSTRARALAPGLGASPGAVVLRSDEVRKRLWGAGPLDRLPGAAYAEGESARVYGAMLDEARLAMAAGRAVVLDAVFLRPQERAAAAELARSEGAAFTGEWLHAPPDVLRARVAERRGDASDADVAVLERQFALEPGPLGPGWTEAPAA
ncbi:MAG: AAA family ATPase [Caulobacteraceae bacterium]|nr:AAA family ATPase [Caulobacter sp.]